MSVPGLPLQMGLDWFIQDVAGLRTISHGGDTLGQHAEFVAVPEQGFAFVLLTNGQSGGSRVASAALDEALARYPGLGALSGQIGLLPSLAFRKTAPITLTSEELAAYAGRYADPSPGVRTDHRRRLRGNGR